MRLLEDFVYIDGAAKRWLAPKTSVIDGASIPRFLWSFIGGPFEGLYRKASVPHDVECVNQNEPWRAVHRMFYNAMRCSGVGEPRAQIMYAAVYHCGPRWGDEQSVRLFPCNSDFMRQFVRRWRTLAYRQSVTLETYENLSPEQLAKLADDPIMKLKERLGNRGRVEDRESDVVVTIYMPAAAPSASPETSALLKDVARVLKDIPANLITVEGHSDASGTAQMNQALSERRAHAVAQKLAEAGIPREILSEVGFGESRPVTSNKTAKGREINRRVEIIIREGL